MDHTRRYESTDLDACLALFDSNVPKFFSLVERPGFERFLSHFAGGWNFHVIESAGRIVACAGYAVAPAGATATLCWGMVDGALHRRGYGSRLLLTRLEAIRERGGVDLVLLDTSQHTQAFYSRFGFVAQQVTPDGYGGGLDRWDMVLRIDETVASPQQRSEVIRR